MFGKHTASRAPPADTLGSSSSGPPTSTTDVEIGLQDEAERKQWQRLQTRKKSEINQQNMKDVDIDGGVRLKEAMDDQQRHIESCLGVDEAGMKESRGVDWIIASVNLAFMMVVVGCEIDLYGFCFSLSEYWAQDIFIVRALLIICPTGYFIAVFMYMGYNSKPSQTGQDPRDSPRIRGGVDSRGSRTQPKRDPEPEPAAVLRRESITISFYHFLPVFRFYVVVKDKEADDVEAIFRVNSLSSFSVGLAQMTGLLFHTAVLQKPLTVFHYINIVSQIVNWSITLLYFGTNVSGYMKAVIKVDAMKYNDTEFLRERQEKFAELQKKSAFEDGKAAYEEFLLNIDNLILLMGNGKIERESLAPLSTDWKFGVLKSLFQKKVARYAKA